MIPPNRTRRRFLGAAALAAAGVAVPYVLPSEVWGAPGKPGPNDRIGIGGIGIGRQGIEVFSAAIGHKLGRAVAVADANIRRAGQTAQRLKIQAYQDYHKLLARKDVDAIVTATPDHWRSLVAIHACQAEKDVYAEKPLTLTIREGRLMVEAARKYGRVFQTGSQQRSNAVNRVGCALVRAGRIGKLSRVLAHNYPSPWQCALPAQPVPDGLDWDLWCGPIEPMPYHIDLCTPRAKPGWISFRPCSGGEMTGWGAHGLDQAQWGLGSDAGGPIEVWTEGPKFDPPTYAKPESQARGDKLCSRPTVFFRYAGDIVMELGAGPAGGAKFFGEHGSISIDRGQCTSDPPELAREAVAAARGAPEDHMGNWLECIRSRQRPNADVEIGHRSATVCHLGNIARWVGRRLRWDPVKECFPDDAEANAHLERKRRKGYELPETL
jgi:predicted dehydrogenase